VTYEFLKTFHKRAEIVAMTDFIITRVSKKVRLKEYGISTNEAINLVLLVLCYIMEKSLVEEFCTKSDIAAYIGKVDSLYLKKNIPDAAYSFIADFIVKDCLLNNGLPFYFNTYNFEMEKEENINIKLIDDKRIELDGEGTYSYYMTPQGYKFMFNTLEIEDALQVSMEQFKLSLSIKKKNFSAARMNVDNLLNIGKTQIQKINYFIKRVKEDIGGAGIEDYERIYNDTFASLDEQKQGYDNLYEMIEHVELALMENATASMDQEKLSQEIDNISYIKNKLKFMISEQTKLLLKQQELQQVYDAAIDNILYIGFESRIDFETVILKKVEEAASFPKTLLSVLRPLFKPNILKSFNLRMALKEQKIVNEVVNEKNNILMSERYFNRLESERETRIRALNECYLSIFEVIVKHTFDSAKRKIMLSDLLNIADDEYLKLVPGLKILTNVLLQLSNLVYIDFAAINDQQAKTVFNPSEEFDVKYCVLSLVNKVQRYRKITALKVILARNKTIFIHQRQNRDRESQELFMTANENGLTCPDIQFEVELANDFATTKEVNNIE
jgi:hypothetical protein